MPAIATRLEELLGDARSPQQEPDALEQLREDAVVESPSTLAGWFAGPGALPYAPFTRRGLLVGFDGEGDYHRPGAHAKLAAYLLARAGLAGATTANRRATPGLWVSVTLPGGKTFERGDPHAHDSDYAFAAPVVAVCNDALSKARAPFRLCQLQSDDQGVLIALLPASRAKSIERALGTLRAGSEEG